ncbi:MAG: right-handed parallel beta-helix repeat-containing protein [Deltaproteobacteria bacterium]|nr:right-handed parallel beta-helix repeat-containing protein [Deltaproteobacteria bacterium]MBI3076626.1 right-handed parallel beta-helix repeat-containing protein [Deltaproteobacteria bacterium]
MSVVRIAGGLALLVLVSAVAAGPATAVTTCTFTVVGTTMTLDADCTTDATILVPDGFTLDGASHTITAVDPPGDHFLGAVVANGGATASVVHLTVTASGLANVCDPASPVDTRLRGILFVSASGTIAHNRVIGINQGASGCQEGNAIEVRNAPFDGSHPNTQAVVIFNNKIEAYQKTGIVANGDVDVIIENNQISASVTQANLAANSIQLGFGAKGRVSNNNVDGNSWCGPSDFAATAVLLFLAASGSEVSQNNIRGNSDVGIYLLADGTRVDNNRVFDSGADCNAFGYDIGVGNYGSGNVITNNKVRGFDTPFDNVTGGKNKVIPRPHD